MEQPRGHAAIAMFEARTTSIQPGTWDFWQVWGARPADIRPGDLLLSKVRDTDKAAVDYVAELFTSKSIGRVGFVNQDGKQLTIGMLAPCIVLRWGTHGTLSDSVR